ncbi:MAG TPA: ubiquitin-like small modifier protein 1 [Candidatus Binatia bacterium]|jgi:molybdopterin synthase sulfur carrier subunit|nr:ubiquitin-like small modifier protein 1 [Candidatus Binatia bacterium]
MLVRVRVPTPLRKFTNGADEVNAQGNTVRVLVEDLERKFPGIKERICDENGKIRRFVNVYVNGDDIRFLQNLETSLKEGDNISIVPAIAGGN